MNIHQLISQLVRFAERQGLIEKCDRAWAANSLVERLGLDSFVWEDNPEEEAEDETTPTAILEPMLDWATEQGILENTPAARDAFDTLLMGELTPRPSETAKRFWKLYEESPEKATDDFYRAGIACNYIRKTRMERDRAWKTPTEYGELDITINLSKPEKDPRDIARARAAGQTSYPKCQLCVENEGFSGTATHPARQNLRLIPLTLGGKPWYLQYSPYGYYNEHCIILNQEHTPMRINRAAFAHLAEFLTIMPHYFAGSNADLPLVGGSILTHDHYQGGRYTFPMDKAPVEKEYRLPNCAGVSVGRVRWPMSALRLRGGDPARLVDLAAHILDVWRGHSDPDADIFAETITDDGREPHNTITPIARRRGDDYEFDLVLRNNRTSPEHPLGIFHPHADLHHLKKENIGLIEVLGLAILPARLLKSLEGLRKAWQNKRQSVADDAALAAHDAWYRELHDAHPKICAEADIKHLLRDASGEAFLQILSDAGVYKRTPAGLASFDRFVATL